MLHSLTDKDYELLIYVQNNPDKDYRENNYLKDKPGTSQRLEELCIIKYLLQIPDPINNREYFKITNLGYIAIEDYKNTLDKTFKDERKISRRYWINTFIAIIAITISIIAIIKSFIF